MVQHPAWEEARNAVLDLAAAGPVTVFLTGEPGSGKTWLLRELAASLSGHGFPTMALLRGDLPIPLGDGVAVLVDEAGYMPERTRAELAVQERGVVVLADIEPSPVAAGGDGPGLVRLHLRLLADAEIGRFAADWLQQESRSSATLEPDGLSRLVEHSGGAVRLITQLLTAAIALTRAGGQRRITGTLIDQVAAFRLGTSIPDMAAASPSPPIPPPPLPAPPPALATPSPATPLPSTATMSPPPQPVAAPPQPSVMRTDRRWAPAVALAGTALAACVVAAVVVPGRLARAPGVEAPLPSLRPADFALPPLHTAEIAASPVVVAANPPMLAARTPAPALAQIQPPMPASPPASSPTHAAIPGPAPPPAAVPLSIASATVPQPTVLPITVLPATVLPVIATNPAAPAIYAERPATTGLVLVAQRGDTLERLYADIYRDRRAPPFAAILAANPTPFKPGAIVVFPEPLGGWARLQR